MKKPMIKVQQEYSASNGNNSSRRKFLKMGSLAVVGSGFLLSCSDDDDLMDPVDRGDVFDLGSGDVGILNYAYALEQLEAAFYTNVLDGSYWMNASAEERLILEDLYKHEVIHRDFFKAAINQAVGGDTSKVLPELEFDFASVDFSDRSSVLGTARVLEDTGVAAYNGAGSLLTTPDYLVIAGKIVSVEARHAAAIRSIFMDDPKAFAGDDVVDENGLDLARSPSQILTAVGDTGFVKTQFTANQLPG
ncbi:ferritin-like domain-containing protein [Zunongwangia sp. F260]|uniref:Ferritin-like domain-containing protein n=1 Tax=Autumnicola lenta TaxID=3075593 RepID=A0ABU3CGR1_9FLAO|nr:ferritin-like domain-containing protein [Zunongwangia sp. F260]MDT0645534.1 ferritin-like domain-containing protein [Zunongwangia sp. F260]